MKLALTLGLAFAEIKDFYDVGFHGCRIGRIWLARDREPTSQSWEWLISLPMTLPDSSKGTATSLDDAVAALGNELGRIIAVTPGPRLQRAFDFAMDLERKGPPAAHTPPKPDRPISEVLADLQVELAKQRQNQPVQPEPVTVPLAPALSPLVASLNKQGRPTEEPSARPADEAVAVGPPVPAPAKPVSAAQAEGALEAPPEAKRVPVAAKAGPVPVSPTDLVKPSPAKAPVPQRAVKLNVASPQAAPKQSASKPEPSANDIAPPKPAVAPAVQARASVVVTRKPPAAPSQAAASAPSPTASVVPPKPVPPKPVQAPPQASFSHSAKVNGRMNGATYVVKRQPPVASVTPPNAATKPVPSANGTAQQPTESRDQSTAEQKNTASANLPVKVIDSEPAVAGRVETPPAAALPKAPQLPVPVGRPAEEVLPPPVRANSTPKPKSAASGDPDFPKGDAATLSDIEALLARHA